MTVNARTARIVATELAAAGVLVAAASGLIAGAAAAVLAAGVAVAVWARPRGRHPDEWLGVALRHRRARPPDVLTGPLRTTLLPPPPARLPHEGEAPHESGPPHKTAIDDAHGLTVLLELGAPEALIAPEPRTLPHPSQLGTAAHVQLVLAIDPAQVRAFLAVRMPHRPGRDTGRDLTGALRTVHAALGDLPHRPLAAPEVHQTLRYLAGTTSAPRQTWRHLHTPGRVQTAFRISGPRPPIEDLAGTGADRVTLAISASDTLVRVAASHEIVLKGLRRLDGEHLSALTATLPLARDPHTDPRTDRRPISLPRDGLFLGLDRDGDPVSIRLFRPSAPTTIALVGDLRGAHLLSLRALAAGTAVVIRTDRPHAWTPLFHAGAVATPHLRAGGPVLEVLDRAGPATTPRSHATLLVLDELTPETAAQAARADLLLLQQLPAGNAAVAERHLGLGRAAGWLTRIRPGMFAVVADRALRWADPTPTRDELRFLDHALT
ncbi:hypothetical protein [Catenuloplanes japonicus]|uniref:hypothetical protein n=1 Tax=Catenuloplanes japonicus TaxID=33876 RepID=UPI000527CA6E|nr:hypothetical protein [Catenuloplanes japonicus]